jgi:phage terminase small subunit
MISSAKFDPSNVEPWKISPTGEVKRVARPRANLNARQERFVVEYLKDGNGTKAAIRAGYATSSAAVQAHRLLGNEKVLAKVRARRNRILRRSEVTVEKTLRALAALAYFDPGCLFDQKGGLLPFNEMPNDALRAVDLLEIQESDKGGRRVPKLKRVKFVDKIPALELLGNHLGMFPIPPKKGG